MRLSLSFGLCLIFGTVVAEAQVQRAEALKIAESYLHLKWKPTAANAFHGSDGAGTRVDTPDASFSRPGMRPGWWVADRTNTGIPYQWGGFSTPEQFASGLRAGKYAGDVYTVEKRRLGDAAVSKQAVGIDCSGLISRCWRLPRAYSTRELPSLCQPLTSMEELKPGDILNSPDNHVLLFREFTGVDRLLAYEAGSPPTWKVLLNSIPLSKLRKEGYRPWRYRGMKD